MSTLFAQHIHPPSGWMQPRLNLIKQGHQCSLPPMLCHQHRGSRGPCVYCGEHESFCFSELRRKAQCSHTCDPFFRHPVGNEPHLRLPCLIFLHRSQHFFMGPVDWSHSSAHWLFVIVVRPSLVMKVNWKWINAEWSSDRGKEGPRVLFLFNAMSFSYGGPVLAGTDPEPSSLAYIPLFFVI